MALLARNCQQKSLRSALSDRIMVPKRMGSDSEAPNPGAAGATDGAPRRIECHRDLSAFFYETLGKALSSRRIEAPQHTECYLVSLLSGLAHDARLASRTLVELRCEAELGPRELRLEKLRALGDRALSASGLFEAHLERQGLSRSYVADMGRSAYRTASHLASASRRSHERLKAEVFYDLGDRFGTYAAVLEDVREATALGGGDDLLSLFERYQKTQSPALLGRMLSQGVWTTPPVGDNDAEPS